MIAGYSKPSDFDRMSCFFYVRVRMKISVFKLLMSHRRSRSIEIELLLSENVFALLVSFDGGEKARALRLYMYLPPPAAASSPGKLLVSYLRGV